MQIVPRRENDAIPYLDELPPPPVDAPTSPASDTETHAALLVVMTANIAMSAIIIAAMLIRGSSSVAAILTGCAYFLASGVAFTFIITGSLTAIVNQWQGQRTERRRIAAYESLGSEWMAIRRMELTARRGSARGVQRISPLSTFVPPYADDEDEIRQEALAWAASLYSADGYPNPRLVHEDGRLKIRMLASKRGQGSQDAGRWLLRNGVIRKVAGGYALLLPHRRQLDEL